MKVTSKPVALVLIGALAVGVVLVVSYEILATGQKIRLSSDYFGVPVPLPGAPERSFTRIEIQAELFERADGEGKVRFHEGALTFDEFGDPTAESRSAWTAMGVTLRPVGGDDPRNKGRRLYELVFPGGFLARRLYLVLAPESAAGHRLLIRMNEEPPPPIDPGEPAGWRDQLLALRDPLAPIDPSAGEPLRFPLLLEMDQFFWRSHRPDRVPQFGTIRIEYQADGRASLTRDRNSRTFTAFGDTAMTTLVAYGPTPGTFKKLPHRDPSGRGRMLLEFLPEEEAQDWRYQVVLASQMGGPHRLLIREGDELRYVLSLSDAPEDPFSFLTE